MYLIDFFLYYYEAVAMCVFSWKTTPPPAPLNVIVFGTGQQGAFYYWVLRQHLE